MPAGRVACRLAVLGEGDRQGAGHTPAPSARARSAGRRRPSAAPARRRVEGEHLAVEGLALGPRGTRSAAARRRARSPSIVVGNQAGQLLVLGQRRHTFSRRVGQAPPVAQHRDEPSRSSAPYSSSGSVTSRSRPGLLAAVLHDLEVALQGVEVGRPSPAVGRQPLVDLPQGLGPDPIDAALGVGAGLDQARLPQDLEVLGDGGLAQRQSPTRSPTGRSSSTSRSRMRRRLSSASTSNVAVTQPVFP